MCESSRSVVKREENEKRLRRESDFSMAVLILESAGDEIDGGHWRQQIDVVNMVNVGVFGHGDD